MSGFRSSQGRTLGERGSALIVSLLILLLMSIIGVSAMRGTINEERMAGNLRDRSLAFEAAESALRDGESYVLNNTITQFTDDCQNGFCTYASGSDSPRWKDTTLSVWSTSGKHQMATAVEGVKTAPEFIVEEIPIPANKGPGQSLVQGFSAAATSKGYSITARGTGATDDAVVILQSVYRK